jgi:hypothetical protein
MLADNNFPVWEGGGGWEAAMKNGPWTILSKRLLNQTGKKPTQYTLERFGVL